MGRVSAQQMSVRAENQGFSLVELMVGVVIGMLGIIVMMNVFMVTEAQKRTSTSSGDAQGNGVVAMATLERDLRLAGYGMSHAALQGSGGCTTILSEYDGTTSNIQAAPVRITDGGTGLSDTVVVNYGNAMAGSVPAMLSAKMTSKTAKMTFNRTVGFEEDDLIIVAQNGVCVLMQITDLRNGNKVEHDAAAHHHGSGSKYNPSSPPATWPQFDMWAKVFNVGALSSNTYSVNAARDLQMLQANDATVYTVASNIVNVQAQYGVAPTGTWVSGSKVDCWVNATTGNACDASDWATPSAENIERIKAVRIALVARSSNPEKATAGVCNTTTAAPVAWDSGPSIDLSATADWQCYRYKVYQTIVPLRNVLWVQPE